MGSYVGIISYHISLNDSQIKEETHLDMSEWDASEAGIDEDTMEDMVDELVLKNINYDGLFSVQDYNTSHYWRNRVWYRGLLIYDNWVSECYAPITFFPLSNNKVLCLNNSMTRVCDIGENGIISDNGYIFETPMGVYSQIIWKLENGKLGVKELLTPIDLKDSHKGLVSVFHAKRGCVSNLDWVKDYPTIGVQNGLLYEKSTLNLIGSGFCIIH